MAELDIQPLAKNRVSTYLYFGSLYFVTVGVLYLWGYWATFDVNILEYLSLADVLKITAYPIASAFVFATLGAVTGELLIRRGALPSGGKRDTRIGQFLRKMAPLLLLTYALGTIALFVYGPVEKWNVLPLLLAIPMYFFAKERGFLVSIIPHESPRSVVIFLLCALPPFSYGHGRLQAATILNGTDYKYVVSPIEGIGANADTSISKRLRYLGHAGDFVFLFQPVNTTLVITRFDHTKSLHLQKFKVSSQPSGAISNTSVERSVPQANIQPPAPRPPP